jgi:hypothetical protein
MNTLRKTIDPKQAEKRAEIKVGSLDVFNSKSFKDF